MVRIYMILGEREKALDLLEPLLTDAVLPLAGVAGDRSELRAAQGASALRETAGLRALTPGLLPRHAAERH